MNAPAQKPARSLRILPEPNCRHTDTEKLLQASLRCQCCQLNEYRQLLEQVREEIEDHHDVVDGADGEPEQPNWAMHLTTLIDTEVERIG
jgi:hypothetical protein